MDKVLIRILVIINLVALLGMSFSGCGTKKAEDLDSLINQMPPLKETTLHFCFAGVERPDTRLVLNEIEKRTKDTLNVKLDFKWIAYQNYEYTIRTMLSSGQPLDAFILGTPERTFTTDFAEMGRKGELKDITEMLSNTTPSLYKKYQELNLLDPIKVDGKIFVLPALAPTAHTTNVLVNEEFMNKYKISPIKTLDDFEKFLKVVKENEKDYLTCYSGNFNTEMFARLHGYAVLDSSQRLVYKWDDPKMKVMAWEQTPEFKEEVNYITDWYKKGYLVSPQFRKQDRNIASFFIGEDEGLSLGSTTIMLSTGTGQKEYKLYNYRLYPDNKIQRDNPIRDIFRSGAMAFNAKSQNVERALMLMDWIQRSKENYNLFFYGIEGKHYKIEKGALSVNEPSKPGEYLYPYWNGFTAFINLEYFMNNAEGKSEYIDYINNSTQYAPHEGFHADYSNIQGAAERPAKFADQIDNPLSQGTFKPGFTDMIISSFQRTGADTIVKEVQNQLDKWLLDNKNQSK